MNVGEYYLKQMVSDSSHKSAYSELPEFETSCLEFWQHAFDLNHWKITSTPISSEQVIDDLHGGTCGHEFVGIAIRLESREAEIFHTRPLKKDDIIHELLHARFPHWSESKVVDWTDKFENTDDPQTLIEILKTKEGLAPKNH